MVRQTVRCQSCCRYLEDIFQKCNAPAYQYNCKQRTALQDIPFFKLQVPVPCECHEEVGYYEEGDR